MSRIAMPNGDDYPDAAHRHLLDAEELLGRNRPDGAAYLSGYVVECSLKCLLVLETGRAPPRHDFVSLLRAIQQAIAAGGARTARYFGAATRGLTTSAVSSWEPQMRYRAPSMVLTDARAWHDAARDVFQETVHQMRLDGVI